MPGTEQIALRILACPCQISHRLLFRCGWMHLGQQVGLEKLHQLPRIPRICFYPVTWLGWNQRRRYHDAIEPCIAKLALQAIPAWPCFIADAHLITANALELAHHPRPCSHVIRKLPLFGDLFGSRQNHCHIDP